MPVFSPAQRNISEPQYPYQSFENSVSIQKSYLIRSQSSTAVNIVIAAMDKTINFVSVGIFAMAASHIAGQDFRRKVAVEVPDRAVEVDLVPTFDYAVNCKHVVLLRFAEDRVLLPRPTADVAPLFDFVHDDPADHRQTGGSLSIDRPAAVFLRHEYMPIAQVDPAPLRQPVGAKMRAVAVGLELAGGEQLRAEVARVAVRLQVQPGEDIAADHKAGTVEVAARAGHYIAVSFDRSVPVPALRWTL